jgi:hypothetical protein
MRSTGEGCSQNVTACSRVARLDERSSSGRGRLRPPPDPATCVSITAARTEPRPSRARHAITKRVSHCGSDGASALPDTASTILGSMISNVGRYFDSTGHDRLQRLFQIPI